MSNRAAESTFAAVGAAVRFLERNQDADGFWRDFQLPPGRSDAWTTACVGNAIASTANCQIVKKETLERAALGLRACRRPKGWGYNGHTACDADSTAWSLRFLSSIAAAADIPMLAILRPYLTDDLHVRTFESAERFGTWATIHDEVAPIVGLALLAGQEHSSIGGIRSAILAAWEGRGWQAYWWNSVAYVRAQSLEFLSASGGVPRELSRRERASLNKSSPPGSAFDAAHQLIATTHLCDHRDIAGARARLIDMQLEDGSWPSSPVLFVPDQRENLESLPHADDRRLLTSAMALMALMRSLDSREQRGREGRNQSHDAVDGVPSAAGLSISNAT